MWKSSILYCKITARVLSGFNLKERDDTTYFRGEYSGIRKSLQQQIDDGQ